MDVETPEDHTTKKDKILDATMWLLENYASTAFSTTEIAEVANVTQPLIHYHFGTKENCVKKAFEAWQHIDVQKAQRIFDREMACKRSLLHEHQEEALSSQC